MSDSYLGARWVGLLYLSVEVHQNILGMPTTYFTNHYAGNLALKWFLFYIIQKTGVDIKNYYQYCIQSPPLFEVLEAYTILLFIVYNSVQRY